MTGITDPRPTHSQTFGYDTLGRLTQAQGAYGTLSWGYRANGDRLVETRSAQGASIAYDYNSANQLTATTGLAPATFFSYGTDGRTLTRTTAAGTTTYGYTATSLPTSVTAPGIAVTSVYDADEWRIRRDFTAGTLATSTYSVRSVGTEVLSEYRRLCAPIATCATAIVGVADKIYAGGRLLGAYEADLVDQVVEFVGTTSANTESWANPTVLARVTTANGAPTTAPMAVTYATVDGSGSATAGADYVSKSAVHTVPAGTLSGTTFSLQFNVLNDAMDEPDETVLLRLTSATNGTIGAAHTLTYSILDDDAPPTIEAVALATVGEAQSAQATVTLSAPSGFAVQATVTLASGTALAGYDFSGRAPGGHGHARPPDGIRDGAAGQRRVGGADGGTVLLHPVESCPCHTRRAAEWHDHDSR